jgi:hypothetical protein
MAAALGIIVVGGLLVASGLKGVSIADLVAGSVSGVLNPAGGRKQFSTSVTDAATTGAVAGATGGAVATQGGARALVDSLAQIAQAAGGGGVYVVSDSRPGSTTSSGNVSDHASNDAERAARDIAVKGVNAITGPPMPELDRAVVAIGKSLGRTYKPGVRIVDTFTYKGFRVQIIWRTPEYGGHMGHIHAGAHRT